MGFEYHLVVSYETILYQLYYNIYTILYYPQIIVLLAVIDKYHKEAAVGGAIQLYKIFKGTQSPFIPTLILTVAQFALYGYNIHRVLGLKHRVFLCFNVE